jgi:outer membrane protein OmpA-like peptidoglycan-associated protein
MKSFSLMLFICLRLVTTAQNLVPNGDFESNQHGMVSDWKQPVDDYYHYDVTVNQTDSGTQYNAINGLCLLQPYPSEFLLAKLKEPLVKGKKYCVGMNIFYSTTFIGSIQKVQSIDISFSDTNIEVYRRRILVREPKIKLSFMDAAGIFYQPAKVIFEADGTEEYIIIGKFHAPAEQVAISIEDKRTLIWKELYYTNDSIKKYYQSLLPPPNGAFTKKEIKKETKRLNDSIAILDALKMEAIYKSSQFYRQKAADLENEKNDSNGLVKGYHVRVYFDNICVAPVLIQEECECEIENKTLFKIGQTYRLNNIHFDLDKSIFRPESYKEMDNLYSILTKYPKMEIQLNGHTDSLNTHKYNVDLSNKRAKAVYDYLIKKGIQPKRLKWKGYGELIPITENTTDKGRAINRRVEFTVIKNEL